MKRSKQSIVVDRSKVALLQPHEVDYIVKKHKVPEHQVIKAGKHVRSRNRIKIYALLRLWGHKIKTKAFPNG